MSEQNFSRKLRQFKNLSQKINHLLQTGKWIELSETVKEKLLNKLKRLVALLQQKLGLNEIKRILASAAVLIGFGSSGNTQIFNPPVSFPFGITPSYEYAYPDAVDIDNDGDLDLFIVEYPGNIKFLENTGSATNPQFALPTGQPFGITSFYYFGFMDFADLDNDGDYDMLGFEYDYAPYEYGNWRFLENTGTPENPQFTEEVNDAFGLPALSYYLGFPEFADIDADGDQDLLVGEYYGSIVLFENIGTAEEAIFGPPQYDPFGLTPNSNYYPVPSIADLDLDDDLDILVNRYEGDFVFYENTGTSQNPSFALPLVNPFGLSLTDSTVTLIDCVDIDGDGDIDILGGGIEYFAPIYFFKNDLITGLENQDNQIEFTLNPNPAIDFVTINIDPKAISENSRLELVDQSGSVVKSLQITRQNFDFSIAGLPSGIYLINIYNGVLLRSEKLVIE